MYRRVFLRNMAGVCAATLLPAGLAAAPPAIPFKLGAISDGFSQNFEEALKIIKGYGLSWVEIRKVFGIYNTEASPAQVKQMKDLVSRYGFQVSVIDSALFKCTLPGTKPVVNEKDDYSYASQMELLKRACDRAQALGAHKVRIFTFWRVASPQTITARISEELQKAAELAKRSGILLVIENEETCNAATGRELAAVLAATPASNLGANWDVGNGYVQGEVSYPDGYRYLDKKRIWHMHLKGMTCGPNLSNCTEAIAGSGQNDLVGQFRALLRDNYQGTMSVECEFEAKGLSHLETTKRSVEGILKAVAKATEAKS